jgi:hypothetical protein
MSYPISINKEVTINFRKLSLDEIISMFSKELQYQYGSTIMLEGQEIKIIESKEFSSKTNLKHFNKGKITFIQNDNELRIIGKFLLIEHSIIFSVITLISISLVKIGFDGIYISIILLSVSFIFLYLFPMISFYSLFNELVKRIEEVEKQ